MNIFNTQANVFKVNGGIADEIANRPLPTSSFYIFWAIDTGEIFYDNGSWIQFGGGGGGNFISDTYSNIANFKATNSLIPGAIYCINDPAAPLHSIYITALTTDKFSNAGFSLQYCPAFYGTGNFNGWFWNGVWRNTLTPNVDSLCVWGARVWRNRNGNVGSALNNQTLDNTEWQLIGNEAGRYVLKSFNIEFNFDLNFISLQSDDKGNIISGRNAQSTNGCVLTDWNQPNLRNNNVQLYILNNLDYIENNICQSILQNDAGVENNFCKGIEFNKSFVAYNNLGYEYDIINNVGGIYHNKVSGNINNNIANVGIFYNSCEGDILFNNVSGFIGNNSNKGNIQYNTVNQIVRNSNLGEIAYNNFTGNIENNSNQSFISANQGAMQFIDENSNGGFIANNENSGIRRNTNNGNIFQNSIATFIIFANSNNGDINQNQCPAQINRNSNTGSINSNGSNVTLIEHNGNTGNINNNNNTGVIQHNNNNGNIANNTCLNITNNYCGGNLSNNSNIGNISSNNNGGPITGNSNAGQIFQNINTAAIQNNSNNGQIYRNMNNGQILGITAPTLQIYSNVNNGDILISTPGNITDPIVNK